MPECHPASPCRGPEVSGPYVDAGLLDQLAQRRVDVRLASIDPASGQLPASALVGIQRFPDPEEQDTLVDVQDDQTYGAAFEDRQILWQFHTPSVPDRGCPIVLVAAASIKGVISVGRLAPPKRSAR